LLTKLARTGAVSAALLLSVVAVPAAFASVATMDELAVAVTPTHNVVTAKDGMTVYAFGMDEEGASFCYGACAAAWPPYLGHVSAMFPAPDGRLSTGRMGRCNGHSTATPFTILPATRWRVTPLETA